MRVPGFTGDLWTHPVPGITWLASVCMHVSPCDFTVARDMLEHVSLTCTLYNTSGPVLRQNGPASTLHVSLFKHF